MKKSNYFTLCILLVSIICVVCFTFLQTLKKNTAQVMAAQPTTIATSEPSIIPFIEPTIIPTPIVEDKITTPISVSLDSTLFIGDSRTVGLMEYGNLTDANFFSDVGMSVFNIYDKTISVPNVGRLTLQELLENKPYQTIYIMLGLNEMGYEFNSIINKYQELISYIHEKEADANIIILGNLHVTSERSDNDSIFNNNAINRLNDTLSSLANNNYLFYIDTNYLYDVDGALDSEKSSDNTHLFAKYYQEWGEWIIDQSNQLMKEE